MGVLRGERDEEGLVDIDLSVGRFNFVGDLDWIPAVGFADGAGDADFWWIDEEHSLGRFVDQDAMPDGVSLGAPATVFAGGIEKELGGQNWSALLLDGIERENGLDDTPVGKLWQVGEFFGKGIEKGEGSEAVVDGFKKRQEIGFEIFDPIFAGNQRLGSGSGVEPEGIIKLENGCVDDFGITAGFVDVLDLDGFGPTLLGEHLLCLESHFSGIVRKSRQAVQSEE